ncbi:hypothetical protein NP233_g924 [Leucocoprinus birnbaumii]|uniref:Uncharacterized protein n=1 Tax=Leucocoprinus birnbaumii TaxID=56174 RepID=A0AAD5W212_9AGAR|nr:hypothetical protein NP233_g924 [Leucocoprinus birnbaumii]
MDRIRLDTQGTPTSSSWIISQKKRDTAMETLENVNILLIDSVFIYKCWHVYGRRFLVITFPFVLWLLALASTITMLYFHIRHMSSAEIHFNLGRNEDPTSKSGIFLLLFWLSTEVLLNVYITGALMLRIYHGGKIACKDGNWEKGFCYAMRVIGETGLLNLLITLVYLPVKFSDNALAARVLDALKGPMIGIAFTWFVLRFEQSKAEHARIADAVAQAACPPAVSAIQFGFRCSTLEGSISPSSVSIDPTFRVAMPRNLNSGERSIA